MGWAAGNSMVVTTSLCLNNTNHGFGNPNGNSTPTAYAIEIQPESCNLYDKILDRII
jgi:hypothetical protein